jgi:uncharacterized protein with NAD-binding domain and iron-sulfur cluster
MNGLKLFLTEPRPIVHGPVGYMNSPWAMVSLSQAQFWKGDFAATYGDGRVGESLSVILSDWDTPGLLYGKPARQCTPQQVLNEVWAQLKRTVNKPGHEPSITDDLLVSWNFDPGMILHNGHLVSGDPLIIPTVDSRASQPEVVTAVPNLVLAGDYPLADGIDGTMECANETGRRAANAVLQGAKSTRSPVTVFPHSRPPEWADLQRLDQGRWRRGQPNLFDADLSLDQLNDLLALSAEALAHVPTALRVIGS